MYLRQSCQVTDGAVNRTAELVVEQIKSPEIPPSNDTVHSVPVARVRVTLKIVLCSQPSVQVRLQVVTWRLECCVPVCTAQAVQSQGTVHGIMYLLQCCQVADRARNRTVQLVVHQIKVPAIPPSHNVAHGM